ncbi:hypothetical protein D3C83_281030 [compost metagenome]
MAGDSTLVHTTMVGGKVVVENGKLLTASANRIIDDANRESVRIMSRAETRLGRSLGLSSRIAAVM